VRQYADDALPGELLLLAQRAAQIGEDQQLVGLAVAIERRSPQLEPSGFGTAGNNIYYLPLRAGAASKAPEVCAIDVAKGKIVAHAEAREVNGKRDVPGNLVFVDGEVLSMSTSELVAFPLRKDGGKRQGTKESDKE